MLCRLHDNLVCLKSDLGSGQPIILDWNDRPGPVSVRPGVPLVRAVWQSGRRVSAETPLLGQRRPLLAQRDDTGETHGGGRRYDAL